MGAVEKSKRFELSSFSEGIRSVVHAIREAAIKCVSSNNPAADPQAAPVASPASETVPNPIEKVKTSLQVCNSQCQKMCCSCTADLLPCVEGTEGTCGPT